LWQTNASEQYPGPLREHRAAMPGFLKTYADPGVSLQSPMDAAVVVHTTLRPSLAAAMRSIFAQSFGGRIHVLVGIDRCTGESDMIERLCAQRPANCVVQVLQPGYSGSARHGGVHPAEEGVLRAVLTWLANSRYVAYLDEEYRWLPDHLRLLRAAMPPAEWAYARRWFVHPRSGRPVCVDEWESVGPDRGVHAERFGGYVDPNCLMIDKLACEHVITWWTMPRFEDTGTGADRSVFSYLREYHRGEAVEQATVYCPLDPADPLHAARVARMGVRYDAAG